MTKSDLIEAFHYEAWANDLWATALTAFDPRLTSPESMARVTRPGPWPEFVADPFERAGEVFLHILWAQRTWRNRIEPIADFDTSDAGKVVRSLTDAWIESIERHEPADRIDYRNNQGTPFNSSFEEIARQVLGHGIYHRGQLREITEGLGLK
ncbi:hypothetical protein EON79_03040, partial [bacterium]